MTDFELMGAALEEARKAAALGEVPVGAVVAVLALAGCGVFAFAPVLMLMASQVGWLFPEDSQRE